MKKKILYMMHIDWNWIKQRPQFLAEELQSEFDVTLFYQKAYRTKGLTKDKHSIINTFKFFAVPFKGRSSILFMLNKFIVKLQIIVLNLFNTYDFIWITHPSLYAYLPKNCKSKIIYDCMDDALEFPKIKNNLKMNNMFFNLENELCVSSSKIFATSLYLKEKLISRYKLEENKIDVINNGINLENLKLNPLPDKIKSKFKSDMTNIVYIGTISEWFNFNVIFLTLKKFTNINFLLFGPTEVDIPHHQNILYCGSINHEYVFSVMHEANLLIMPFKVNELIKSVNPVKAYEYIFSGKPSLIVEYDETKKFKDYLYLYKNDEDFVEKVDMILFTQENIEGSKVKKDAFIKNSSWDIKAKEISSILKEL